MYQEKGLYLPYNEILKKTVDVPIISAGRMEDPELATQAILDGKTDIIARPLLADADIPNKILADDYASVRPCLSCQEGCMGRLQTYATVSCAINPACAREQEYSIGKAEQRKKVLVIGGGVAGCEAARVAALRGHQVILLEKTAKLGGNLLAGGVPDFKEDDLALIKWYELQIGKMDIDVRLNILATKELVASIDADSVILATGSTPKKLEIEGSDKVYSAEEVLLGKKRSREINHHHRWRFGWL